MVFVHLCSNIGRYEGPSRRRFSPSVVSCGASINVKMVFQLPWLELLPAYRVVVCLESHSMSMGNNRTKNVFVLLMICGG